MPLAGKLIIAGILLVVFGAIIAAVGDGLGLWDIDAFFDAIYRFLDGVQHQLDNPPSIG